MESCFNDHKKYNPFTTGCPIHWGRFHRYVTHMWFTNAIISLIVAVIGIAIVHYSFVVGWVLFVGGVLAYIDFIIAAAEYSREGSCYRSLIERHVLQPLEVWWWRMSRPLSIYTIGEERYLARPAAPFCYDFFEVYATDGVLVNNAQEINWSDTDPDWRVGMPEDRQVYWIPADRMVKLPLIARLRTDKALLQ